MRNALTYVAVLLIVLFGSIKGVRAETQSQANSEGLSDEAELMKQLKMAVILRSAGDLPKALDAFDLALEQFDWSADVHFERGITLSWMGRLRKSRQSLSTALKLDSGHIGARLALARVQVWQGEFSKAHKTIQVLREKRDSYELAVLRGDLARGELRLDAARVHYKRAATLQPSSQEAKKRVSSLEALGRTSLRIASGLAQMGESRGLALSGSIRYQLSPQSTLGLEASRAQIDESGQLIARARIGFVQHHQASIVSEWHLEKRGADIQAGRSAAGVSIQWGSRIALRVGGEIGRAESFGDSWSLQLGALSPLPHKYWAQVQAFHSKASSVSSTAIVGTVGKEEARYSWRLSGALGRVGDQTLPSFNWQGSVAIGKRQRVGLELASSLQSIRQDLGTVFWETRW